MQFCACGVKNYSLCEWNVRGDHRCGLSVHNRLPLHSSLEQASQILLLISVILFSHERFSSKCIGILYVTSSIAMSTAVLPKAETQKSNQMTSTPPPSQLVNVQQSKTLNARPAAIDRLKKQLQCHYLAKDSISTECNRLKKLCSLQLRRLFTDFWDKESKLTVLSELLSQKNLFVLAILREHIKHLMHRINRAPSAHVLVPLFKSAAEGDIALSKAHLSHVKLLFYYVCLAFRTCANAYNIAAHPGKQSGPAISCPPCDNVPCNNV